MRLAAALTLYGSSNLDLGETMLLAAMEQQQWAEPHSDDADFNGGPRIPRGEP